MLISSRFHDFYDCGAQYGIDKTIVYNRFEESHKIPNRITHQELNELVDKIPRRYQAGYGMHKEVLEPGLLLFCGEIFPFIEFKGICYYSDQKLFDALNANNTTLSKDGYYWWNRGHDIHTAERITKFLVTKDFAKLSQLHHIHKSPIIIIWDHSHHEECIKVNPSLKAHQFQTQKDPFTTFQLIQSYISGVIGMPAKPMVKISDKDLAAKRGHDGQYSFRRPPNTKKWR